MHGVHETIKVTKPFKLAGKEFSKGNLEIKVGPVTFDDKSFVIMAGPAEPYFASGRSKLRLKAEGRYTRAAAGGTGAAKTSGNYAGTLKPMAEARGVKLTYLPFFMKCCSIAFRDFPNVNAVMDEEAFELVVKGDHNIGIATDTPNGLYVPVVKNVEQKSILALAAELQDLTARTRAGKVSLDELRGGTFTITGVGSIGGVMATPILNVPEVGILGTNAIRDRVVPINGELVVRKMMYLSNSFDHRIIDGAVGARFTARLKEIIETPEALLLDLS